MCSVLSDLRHASTSAESNLESSFSLYGAEGPGVTGSMQPVKNLSVANTHNDLELYSHPVNFFLSHAVLK